MQRKAFVLLSGGLDSTTCLYKAIHDYCPYDLSNPEYDAWDDLIKRGGPIDWVTAYSVNYGQRHAKEMEYAHETCTRLGIEHHILDVGSLLSGAKVMLSRDSVGSVAVPDIAYSEIKGVSPTYVPFRNGLMLAALVAQAQKYVNAEIEGEVTRTLDMSQESTPIGEQEAKQMATNAAKDLCGVYFGAHSEDAQNWAYPDCTPEFIGAMANAIYVGTYMTVRLHTPLQWLMKSEIVSLGDKLGVPFENTWSCYKGEDKQCGTCPTCRSPKEAFQIAGVKDPTTYSDDPVEQIVGSMQPTPNAEA